MKNRNLGDIKIRKSYVCWGKSMIVFTKQLLSVICGLCLFATVQGQTLIVQARPSFSDTGFIQNNGHHYLLAEIQEIRTGGTQFDRISSTGVQYQDFYFIRPDGYVECQINIPTSGNYHIYTYLVQHGNSGPRSRVYVDGAFRNEITGSRRWSKTSVYLHAGVRTIRYEESGSGSTAWPLRLVGFDAVAISNDPHWTPPTELATHPYTGNRHWWQRPSEQLSQIEVSVDGKTATYNGTWNYTDLLLIDSTGASQATPADFSVSGDSLAGENLSYATVSQHTVKRFHSSALLISRTHSRITPNYDMIDDEVGIIPPSGQAGYVRIKQYDDSTIRQMPNGDYTWEGRVSNNIYSEFAQRMGYLLEFVPTSGGSTPRLACVYSNPQAPSKAHPRVREISPNGDNVYDAAEVFLKIDYNTSDTVIVRDSTGSIVRNLPKQKPIVWDGKNADGDVCAAGQYSIEVLDGTGQLRAGSRINVLDLPPTGQEPHDPDDFFVLGMWLGFNSTSSADLNDIKAMNCNAIRHPHSGTTGSASSRSASSWWPAVESRNLKVLVNLAEIVHPILDMPMAPSEPHLEALLAPYVNPIKHKSALLGYELIDEPKYSEEWGYRLRAIQQALHRLDSSRPSVPVLIGYDQRISGYTLNLQPHQLLLDIYPCNKDTQPGDFRNIWGYQNLEMMDYVDWAMAFVEPRGVPTWIIHQGHNFLDQLREPIPSEIGLQVWLGLTRAITGSYFFIYETQQCWTGIKDNPPLKTAVTEIYGRLSQPAIYSILPHLKKDNFNLSISGGGNPHGYTHGEARPLTDGTHKYVIAVNRNATSSSQIALNSTDYPTATLKDLETNTEYAMGQTINFAPGDGKIFEVVREELAPPDAPQELSFSNITETKMRLVWQAPSGNSGISGYHIYDGADDTLLQSTTSTYHQFTGLGAGHNYSFYVIAYNSAGQSPASEVACQETFPAEPPTMPDNVKVSRYGATQIQIEWDESVDNVGVLNYDVFLDGRPFDTVTGTSYHFVDLHTQTRYEFQVQARDVDGGLSALTPPICAVTCQNDTVPMELEGHWKFDENTGLTAFDSSSYGRTGSISTASWTTGYLGTALQFNGTSSKVDAGVFDVSGNQLTIAAWVRADGFNFTGDNRILSKAEGSAETDHFWMLGTRRSGSDYFFRFRLKTNGTTNTLQGASQSITVGNWAHVCATYDGSLMRLYVNGVLDSATLATYGVVENGDDVNVLIGANPNNGSVWQGVIDDVRIYSAALSGDQVQQVMEGQEPLPPGPSEASCNRLVDFNCDGIVDIQDFFYIAYNWGQAAFPGLGDVTESGVVDMYDLEIFISEWLQQDAWILDEENN